MLNTTIGKRIRDSRLEREITQEKLAEYLRISHQQVSKWENGITTPSIESLFSMAQLFGVSIDYLCGTEKSNAEKIKENAAAQCPYRDIFDYDVLNEKYPVLESMLKTYPLNEELFIYSLEYLRRMHDTIKTDDAKWYVNDLITKNAERILDISKNADYRSIANFNMALCYSESVSLDGSSPEDKENAAKAKEYADKVLYKHMSKVFYSRAGAVGDKEFLESYKTTLKESIAVINCAVNNLRRYYKRKNMTEESDRLENFAIAFKEGTEQLEL